MVRKWSTVPISLSYITPNPARPQMNPRRPFATALVLERNNGRWIHNLHAARHYVYAVHTSRAFLAITSLASALYLLLLRLLDGRYDDAFHVAQWCFSDTAMSAEEHQVRLEPYHVAASSKADPKAQARLDLELSVGWASSHSRGLWGGHALLLSTETVTQPLPILRWTGLVAGFQVMFERSRASNECALSLNPH